MTAGLQTTPTAAKKAAFLEAYTSTGNISRAARAARIGRRTHYEWLEAAPAYAHAFADATDAADDDLAGEARRRAVEGIPINRFTKDGVPFCDPSAWVMDPDTGSPRLVEWRPYVERRYSDGLLALLLKAARPELYSDRHRPKASGGKDQTNVFLEEIVGGGGE